MVSWWNTNCNIYNFASKIPITMCYLKAFRDSMKFNSIVFNVSRLYMRLLNLYFFQTQVNNKGEKIIRGTLNQTMITIAMVACSGMYKNQFIQLNYFMFFTLFLLKIPFYVYLCFYTSKCLNYFLGLTTNNILYPPFIYRYYKIYTSF